MSDHVPTHPVGSAGLFVVATSAVVEAASPSNLTPWTQFFALAGFLLTILTSLPRLEESFALLRRWGRSLRFLVSR